MSMPLKSKFKRQVLKSPSLSVAEIFSGEFQISKGMDRVQADYMGMLWSLTVWRYKAHWKTTMFQPLKRPSNLQSLLSKEGPRVIWKRKGRYFWIGNGKPLFHNRFCRSAARHRNQCRCDIKGNTSRWHLWKTPKKTKKPSSLTPIIRRCTEKDSRSDTTAFTLSVENNCPLLFLI